MNSNNIVKYILFVALIIVVEVVYLRFYPVSKEILDIEAQNIETNPVHVVISPSNQYIAATFIKNQTRWESEGKLETNLPGNYGDYVVLTDLTLGIQKVIYNDKDSQYSFINGIVFSDDSTSLFIANNALWKYDMATKNTSQIYLTGPKLVGSCNMVKITDVNINGTYVLGGKQCYEGGHQIIFDSINARSIDLATGANEYEAPPVILYGFINREILFGAENKFEAPYGELARLGLYDVSGNKVKNLTDNFSEAHYPKNITTGYYSYKGQDLFSFDYGEKKLMIDLDSLSLVCPPYQPC